MRWYEIFARLLIAVLVGGIVGYEREHSNRPAGFRTHMLVCVGATIISLIQVKIGDSMIAQAISNPSLANLYKVDMGRLGAAVISGVGFLGAGTILHQKGNIQGLTTAASLWVVACIGLAVGLGYYVLSLTSLAVVVIILVFLRKVEVRIFPKFIDIVINIEYYLDSSLLQDIGEYLKLRNVTIKKIEFIDTLNSENLGSVNYKMSIPKGMKNENLILDMSNMRGIKSIKIVR